MPTVATKKAKSSRKSISKEYAFRGHFPTVEQMLAGESGSDNNIVLRIALCKNAKDGFIPLEMTWNFFLRSFRCHSERDTKDGLAAIFADIRELRTDENVVAVTALAYEIDGKLTLEEVKARVSASGKVAFVWTTHNHLRASQKVGEATYKKWHLKRFGVDAPPTDATVSAFCSENLRYSHLRDVRLADEGRVYVVREWGRKIPVFDIAHAPEHKTRIVFPLATPIALKDGTRTICDYKAIYHAHGINIFGDAYSTESQNPARLHYLPSHPPGMTGETIVFGGELVDSEPIWSGIKAAAPAIETQEPQSSHRTVAIPSAGLDELEYILRQIPPDLEYPDWFKCIAAIFYETSGSDAGAELAHSWSSRDPRYSFEEVERIWDSLDLDHRKPARIGTLVKIARSYNDAFRPYRMALKILDFILHKKDQ
jgi:hypothetical protein